MQRLVLTLVLAGIVIGGIWVVVMRSGDSTGGSGSAIAEVSIPQFSDVAAAGETVFAANCASCHGENAAGSDGAGPPLVHKIYEPGHHANMAFRRAVKNGVRSHHWRFGNMPPIAGVSDREIGQIIAYVRELQRANGIN